MIKLLSIAGARPNFMKIAPLIREIDRRPSVVQRFVHTGQHYDASMSDVFLAELGIPKPSDNLGVGPGERLEQIDLIMDRFEPVFCRERPDAVLVVGDVNSTIACARVAKSHGGAVIHVEAGLRSFDWTMPEEHNRVETDRISDLLFVTEASGMENIKNEGLPGKAFHVGNVMIDTLVHHLERATKRRVHERFSRQPGDYVVATFHRPSNVDDVHGLSSIIEIAREVCKTHHLIFPMHPRTSKSFKRHELYDQLIGVGNVSIVVPLGYFDFISLISKAAAVITDSGGIQEETTYLQVPCITMRDNTERPITVEAGTNHLAGTDVDRVIRTVRRVLDGERKGRIPALWDGHASERILDVIEAHL